MTIPTHSADDRYVNGEDRLRFGIFQQTSNAPSASGPPITLPDEVPEHARDQIPDHVLSSRQSIDGDYGIVSYIKGGDREQDAPDDIPVLKVDEMHAHMREHADIWEPDTEEP